MLLRVIFRDIRGDILRDIRGEGYDKPSRIQVSDNFQIIPLSWVRIYSALRKNRIHKTANQRSRARINYIGLSELIRIIFMTFCIKFSDSLIFCFLDLRKPFLLSYDLHQFRIKYTFVNKGETITFPPYLISPEFRNF